VLQGEREMATNNKTLGRFHLTDIPPAPRGMPQIEVGFDIDANGIVHVQAKDLGTGKEQKLTITASSGLSKDDVEKMVGDAESHAEEDKKLREAADARNRADQLVYQTEKTIKDNADKIGDAEKAEAEEALKETKEALEQGDVARMQAGSERLEKAAQRLAEAIYHTQAQQQPEAQAAAGAEGANGAADPAGPTDDVIDAEVVDTDERSNGTQA